MKRNTVGLGGTSLVLMFSVLCLAIFAILTLSSANREQTLTDKLKASTTAYYAADSAAVEIEVQLQKALACGENPTEIGGVAINVSGGAYSYSCPIDGRRALAVTLSADGDGLCVLQWSETDVANWSPQEQVDIWKGK